MNILTYIPMPMPIVVHGGGGSVAAPHYAVVCLLAAMFFVCVILLYWIYAKYDNHANIDIDFKDYCQWKKETKCYKPIKGKENEVQESKIK